MEKRYQLIDYYIKDLCPDEQRGIYGDLRDFFTSLQREVINDVDNGYKNIFARRLFENNEQLEKYLNLITSRFMKINERMIKNNREPLFKNLDNLKESMSFRDKLITFMTESECNEIVGSKSFEEYQPKIYKSEQEQ